MKKYLAVVALAALLPPAVARDVAAHIMPGSCQMPQWPKESLRALETGAVTVGFLVGEDGALRETSILSSSGFERLDRTAAAAVRDCKFHPATENGTPITAWGRIAYRFKFDNSRNREAVLATLERRARLGSASDQLQLGQLYQSGDLGADKVASGIDWIRRAADQGLPDAQMAMALALNPGQRWDDAPAASLEWLHKAAANKQSMARLVMSRMLAQQGQRDQAQALFDELLADQYPAAMYLEAKRLLDNGASTDEPRAIALLEGAIIQGNRQAHWLLALCYASGRGVPQSDELAVSHMQQAAQAPIAPAQRALALAYETGKGIGQDAALARLWRETANATDKRRPQAQRAAEDIGTTDPDKKL